MIQTLASDAVAQLLFQTGTALDQLDPSQPETFLAPLVVLLAGYILFHQGLVFSIEAERWEALRSLLPLVDDVAEQIGAYTHYEIAADREAVGVLLMPSYDATFTFLEAGWLPGPVAAHKGLVEDDREETASLVRYGIADRGVFARFVPEGGIWFDGETLEELAPGLRWFVVSVLPHQQHVTTFQEAGPDGEDWTLITAHEEYSAKNPFVALWHLRGHGLEADPAIAAVAKELDADVPGQLSPSDRAGYLTLRTNGGGQS